MLERGLGYGTAEISNMYRDHSDEEAFDVLQSAWDLGIRFFDSAPAYGRGLAELRLGSFLATKKREDYQVSTKVGKPLTVGRPPDSNSRWDVSRSELLRGLDGSLERLGLDRVDYFLLHDPNMSGDDDLVIRGIGHLESMRGEGLLSAIGVGSMDERTLVRSVETGSLDVLMAAGRMSLANVESSRVISDVCQAHGVRIFAAAVFNSGLLASSHPSPDDRYDYFPVSEEVLSRVRAIAQACEKHGVALPAAAIQYPFRLAAVQTVVVGTAEVSQLVQDVDWLHDTVEPSAWADIESAA